MRFVPVRLAGSLLLPVNQRSFVAPLQQAPHGLSMRTRQHESFHSGFAYPYGARPERAVTVTQQRHREVTLRFLGLPRRAKGIEDEWQKILPRADAQTSDRNDCHGVYVPQL